MLTAGMLTADNHALSHLSAIHNNIYNNQKKARNNKITKNKHSECEESLDIESTTTF